MNESSPFMQIHERLLTFEVGGSIYALPIANFGEILITLGLITTGIHFAKQGGAQTAGTVEGAAVAPGS